MQHNIVDAMPLPCVRRPSFGRALMHMAERRGGEHLGVMQELMEHVPSLTLGNRRMVPDLLRPNRAEASVSVDENNRWNFGGGLGPDHRRELVPPVAGGGPVPFPMLGMSDNNVA